MFHVNSNKKAVATVGDAFLIEVSSGAVGAGKAFLTGIKSATSDVGVGCPGGYNI